jgi:DNA-binding CsgD family transcriptional regulator
MTKAHSSGSNEQMFGAEQQVPETGHRHKGAALAMVPSQTVAELIMGESIDRLRSHFGLTQAEARLALHLVTGETLRSAAVKLSITYQTARTHLNKTGTCRQTQLTRASVCAVSFALHASALDGLAQVQEPNCSVKREKKRSGVNDPNSFAPA